MTGSGTSRSPSERLERSQKLRSRRDFQRCYRRGQRRSKAALSLHFVANREGEPRLGITASRRVGNSVVRHRVKRRVREIFRRWPGRRELPALDLVVHLRPEAASLPFAELERQLGALLEGLIRGRGR